MASIYRAAFASLGFALICSGAHADVSISKKPTANMSCSGGVCTATAKKAALNVGDLTNMLASGDITVRSGDIARDIHIRAPFSWTSTGQLTLDANCSITFYKHVLDAGSAAVTLTTSDGGACGSLVFTGGGRLDFWDLNSALTINGSLYKLAGDIQTLANDIAKNLSGNFALAKNYDAKSDGAYAAAPVQSTFNGHLEGLGHTISHLHIRDAATSDHVGLFSILGESSIVENLALTHFNISGATNVGVGGLAGMANGTIENVSADGTLAGPQSFSGALAGYNSGLVVGSRTSGKVTGEAPGGFVGFDYGTIEQSISSAAVIGNQAGGFTSYEQGNVISSSASGAVRVEGPGVGGGFVGAFYATSILQSFATGAVSGRDSAVGGFAGVLEVTAGGGAMNDNYATGAVKGTGSSFAGGFAGWSGDSFDLTLARAYSTGSVSGKGKVGGFIGWDQDRMFDSEITDAYWDFDTSGISNPSRGAGDPPDDPGITGLADVQLKSALPAGFDPNIWGQSSSINNGYPYLLANPPQ